MYSFEELQKANLSIKTTDIKGKDYAEVNQRIKAFRSLCPHGAIVTDMVSNEDGVCVFRATVYDEDKQIIGTGTAYEKESSSYINKTSYIENCETSAVGRALGMCGFGIDTSVASYEEVANAIENQNKKPTPEEDENQKKIYILTINKLLEDTNTNGVQMIEYVNKHFATEAKAFTDLNAEQLIFALKKLEQKKAKAAKNNDAS